MASGALHDLFQDMYRYTDPATFPQEGALPSAPHKQPPQQNQPSYTYNPTSQSYQPSNPTSQTYQPSNPTSQTYQPSNPTNQTYQPSNPTSQTYQPSNPTYQPSRAQTNGTAYGGPNTFTDQNYGRGYQPQPAPGSFPPTAPPSYNDVQSNREQVTYPYQPTTAPAANPYGYPHSVSSSTSELSDISSGYGAYDTKPGSRQMASPGGGIKVYTSGSPADSSSGVGSYSCETPDQAETTYQATVKPDVVRQDSFPLPPPPLHSEQSPPTRLEQQLSNMSIGGGSDYGRQNSFPAPPTPPTYAPPAPFSPSHPPGAPPAPHYGGQSPSVQPQRSGPAMPDAVLNMAAKGEPDKKPWAYAPDMASIKDQRDKVRKSGNKNDKNDVTQSPVYRMIHGLDADKARSRQVAPQQQHQQPQQQQQLHPNQQQQYRQPEDNNQIGDYDQASIRYTGRNIPSKSFRMLQSMTGPEPPTQATQPTRQRRRPQPQPEPESNPDDIVDISYVGGNIPSRSFKVLQQAMGQPDHQAQAQQPAPFSSCDSQNTDQGQGQTRTVKVIKLRSSQPAAEPSGVTDF